MGGEGVETKGGKNVFSFPFTFLLLLFQPYSYSLRGLLALPKLLSNMNPRWHSLNQNVFAPQICLHSRLIEGTNWDVFVSYFESNWRVPFLDDTDVKTLKNGARCLPRLIMRILRRRSCPQSYLSLLDDGSSLGRKSSLWRHMILLLYDVYVFFKYFQ